MTPVDRDNAIHTLILSPVVTEGDIDLFISTPLNKKVGDTC